MPTINVDVDEIRERIRKGEELPLFEKWLKTHPNVEGKHRFSIVKGKSGFFLQMRDPYPPSDKQIEARAKFAEASKNRSAFAVPSLR